MLYIIAGKNYPLSNLILSQINNKDVTLIQNNTFFIYKNKFTEFAGKICFFFKIKNKHIFSKTVYKKFSEINENDKILLWDIVKPDFVFFIKNAVSTNNISLWVWNKLDTEIKEIEKLKKMGISIYTFDKSDSQNFGLQLKKQVCYEIPQTPIKIENESDVYFVGFDKGRYSKINDLYNYFKHQNLICDFNIIPDSTSKSKFNPEIKTVPINVQNNILHIENTKCLVDITKEKQTGITVRVLEALMFRKKLITNNISILHSDLYCKENMFILGIDDTNTLADFVKSPFVETNLKIQQDYYINNWIKSFI